MNNTHTVEKLFSGRLFSVPDYQRGYAWEEVHLDAFLEDLDLLPEGRHHYTGTVVLHRRDSHPDGQVPGPTEWDRSGSGYERFDIVDGQQRLTTVVLLLDSIRRELASQPEHAALADGTVSSYIRVPKPSGEWLYKLRLNADTTRFWMESILADSPGPEPARNASEKRLQDAQDYFSRYLKDQLEKRGGDYIEWLLTLRAKITTRLAFVLYEVSSSADVGVIFEVMNDRGKQLTELEKAKNYLLYLASKLDLPDHSLGDAVNETWTGVFRDLLAAHLTEPRYEDQLLRAHWLMAYNPDRRTWDGTASVKGLLGLRKHEGRHEELLAAALQYVKSLKNASHVYREIHHPYGSFETPLTTSEAERLKLEKASRRLLRVGALAAFLPLLIATRMKHPTDADHYVDMVDLCERFGFRVYRLLGKYSNAGQSSLFRLAHEVYTGKRSKESAVERMRELIRWYSPNGEFEHALSDDRERRWYPWSGLKYFLYEWEDHLANGRAVDLSWEKVERSDLGRTIEHILPQTPTDPYWTFRFTPDQLAQLTHDVGNLVLTDDNSSYQHKSFDKKKGTVGDDRAGPNARPCYANSILFQERALAQVSEWTPEQIIKRRRELLEWARERWKIEDAEGAEGVPVEDAEADEDVELVPETR
jgi:hypothetical protein